MFGTSYDNFDADLEIEDEAKLRLHDLLHTEKDAMVYEHDFGDSWAHKITLEKVLPYDKTQALPVRIKGKRACPRRIAGECGDMKRC